MCLLVFLLCVRVISFLFIFTVSSPPCLSKVQARRQLRRRRRRVSLARCRDPDLLCRGLERSNSTSSSNSGDADYPCRRHRPDAGAGHPPLPPQRVQRVREGLLPRRVFEAGDGGGEGADGGESGSLPSQGRRRRRRGRGGRRRKKEEEEEEGEKEGEEEGKEEEEEGRGRRRREEEERKPWPGNKSRRQERVTVDLIQSSNSTLHT